MHLHDINTLLNLQGVLVTHITEPVENTVYITLEPIDLHQPCPVCGNNHTIRRGKSRPRHVRHLNLFENRTILILPTIRLTCKDCGSNFTWEYSFVKPKSRYTNAIRIADRFHVNRYITEALHSIRKRVSRNLNTYQSKFLKQNKKLLEKRNDSLTKDEQSVLETILRLSSELKEAYWFKEALIEWYDYSNKTNAMNLLEKWIQHGESLDISEVSQALKTFKNWKIEIANYHQCRFTNAAVEGKNNKIKALQRRSYFLRNRQSYDYRIYLECNSEFLPA